MGRRARIYFVFAVLATTLALDAPAQAATFYMDRNGGSCKPVTSYEDAKACDTMQEAYAASALGDTVLIRDGSYPGQLVAASVSKGRPDVDLADVHFRAEGSAARFSAVRFYVPHVRLSGVEVNGMLTARYRPENPSYQASGDAHFDHVRVVNGGRVTFSAVKNFSITDSLIADNWRDGIDIYATDSGAGDAGHYPENGLVGNNVIRDLDRIDDDHIDGIQFTAGINVVIRDNQIGPRIHHQGLLAKTDKGPLTDIRIEDNTFYDVVNPGFSLMAMRFNRRQCDRIDIVGNTFHRPPAPRSGPDDQCAGTLTDNTISEMSSFACQQWLETFMVARNAFLSGEPCGSDPNPGPEAPPAPPSPPPSAPAVADWTHSPAEKFVGEPVTLDGSASTGDGPLDFLWRFEGCGANPCQTRKGGVIQFTFQGAGSKTITLVVTDADGDTDSETQTFAVNKAPVGGARE